MTEPNPKGHNAPCSNRDFDFFYRGLEEERLLVQRCAGSPARCSAVVDIGYGDRSGLASAARQAWEAARTGELRYPPSVLAERGGTKDDGSCKLCKSPGLWVGVGAAVVLGTVITYIALSSDKPPPRLTVDGRDF